MTPPIHFITSLPNSLPQTAAAPLPPLPLLMFGVLLSHSLDECGDYLVLSICGYYCGALNWLWRCGCAGHGVPKWPLLFAPSGRKWRQINESHFLWSFSKSCQGRTETIKIMRKILQFAIRGRRITRNYLFRVECRRLVNRPTFVSLNNSSHQTNYNQGMSRKHGQLDPLWRNAT